MYKSHPVSLIAVFAKLWFAAVCRAENVGLVRRDLQKAFALGGIKGSALVVLLGGGLWQHYS